MCPDLLNFKYCLTVFTLFAFSASYAQTADFTISESDNNHCAPYRVTFTQACSGNPVAFVWNFGNGEKGAESIENVEYIGAGTYTISLTAIYATKAVSVTKTLTVNPTPIVSLSGDRSYLCTPDSVTFTADDNSIVNTYEWNFGDDSIITSAGNTFSHRYSDYGNYTAVVKAISGNGCADTGVFNIRIARLAITTSISENNGCLPAQTRLEVGSTLPGGDAVLNYSWDFGDGSAIINTTDSSVNHTYNSTDSITNARVTINTMQGCSNQANFEPFAFGRPPANITASTASLADSFCASEKIAFKSQASNANYYTWNFGDSVELTVSDTLALHQYYSLGDQQVKVTPFLNGCAGAADSFHIFVKGVIAAASYSNLCNRKNDYRFTDKSKGNISYHGWEFSDVPGNRDTTQLDIAHQFPLAGTFKASLFLFDANAGCGDTLIRTIYTAVPSLVSSTTAVCQDSAIEYHVINSFPPEAGYSYTFYVNGDSLVNGSDTVLNFHPNRHGSYNEYVILNDGNPGTCDDTLFMPNYTIVRGPIVRMQASNEDCVNRGFSFADNSTPYYPSETINKWDWHFGDSSYSTAENPPLHHYPRPGSYEVTLVATDINGCAQRYTEDVMVRPLPKITAFPASTTICQYKDTAILTGYTIDSLSWMPATDISCTLCDTTLAYPVTSTSYVAVAKNKYGCIGYDTCVVKVLEPVHFKVSPADTSVCPGQPVHFSLNANGIITWMPALGLDVTNSTSPVATTFSDISYQVVLKDSANCFADTATANIHVFPNPSVNAGADLTLPYNTGFNFTPNYGADVVSYLWQPATGLSCYNCASPSGIATKNITYTITTTSAKGCSFSDQVNIFIKCENSNLLLPTAFSPNGNGINEYFYPIARGYKTIKRFVIFNRNGNKVFERQNFPPNDPAQGWDGITRGAENVGSTETFAWYIEAECEQGELVTNKGTVVLVR